MDRDEFCLYLESTLIPDLIDMGMVKTADDFTTALRFIRNRKDDVVLSGDNETPQERADFAHYLQKTLIPDLRAAKKPATAADFRIAVRFIKYPSLNFHPLPTAA